MSAIVCSHIAKAYGSTSVIQDFNLEINDHEFVVFLGPSGCGKSTLLRMLAGLEQISSGELSIDGRVVNEVEPRERGIAMVFQNYALYPHMTIFDNIAFGLRRLKVPLNEIEQRVGSVSATLGLGPYLNRKPSELSGGQQQRVAIARAMIKTPKVFLFDEPLSNLDAKLRNHMRVEIARLHQSLKTTTVYVTHDQLEAMTLADRIVLMRSGQIEQVATPEEIYERPRTQFVAGFIGTPAMNFLDATVRKTDGWRLEVAEHDFAVSGHAFRLKDGMQAVLGIRPADFSLGSTANAAITFSGKVALAEFHGNDALISVPFGSGEVTAIVPSAARIRVGDEVTLTAPEERLHLFDQASGETLRA
ncbi:ABC transporter ATP-binding protein [Mesorhizobium amorphae]|uniref:ABC transporter ATP-binding protein n=1 Tax=Mesorhizobium amorphae TaxID=71433 RepID=UPI0011826BF5|nr:sn-glycerol-3-phosphate ABC transporter ATP-binding protein UgpC [Mesorhizobium amorphae]